MHGIFVDDADVLQQNFIHMLSVEKKEYLPIPVLGLPEAREMQLVHESRCLNHLWHWSVLALENDWLY